MNSPLLLGIAGLAGMSVISCTTTEEDPYYDQGSGYGQGGDYVQSGQTGNNPYSGGYGTGAPTDGSANGGTGAYGSNPYGNNPYSGGGYNTGGGTSGGGYGTNYNTGSSGGYSPPPPPPPTNYGNTSAGGGGSHTVVAGDTLYGLSRRYGTTVDAIMTANNLPDVTIYRGQTLRIP